ncbi:fimbrial protein [Burkholderia stabilis]|uniref:fimbrial protein n=1 Tax=Burkholderia stabilis TaxID=95485 RepID=UPI001F4A9272|nr:fimbrial protein [Burkholderia stabilis]
MKRFSRVCLLATVLLVPNWAQAAAAGCKITPTDPAVFTFPGFKVDEFDPSIPDGTIISANTVSLKTGTLSRYDCTWVTKFLYYRGVTAIVGQTGSGSKAGAIYSTGIAGIGMRLSFPANTPVGAYWPQQRVMNSTWSSVNPAIPVYVLIEFIKTGPITAGGVLAGEVGEWNVDNLFKWISIRVDGVIGIQPQVPTCRVTTPAITVPLGNMPASTFTGVGTVSSSKPFNIVLQCSGGEKGAITNVHTTLTDHTDPGNVSDTLSLASDSSATGIGIQVLNGSTVIKYGPDSSAAGNTNQWKAGEAGNGTFTIPLTARYIQTAPKVTPGAANGLATFTMSYQ